MFKKILFATDGSAASDHAAAMAVSLARTHNASLIAVYVVDPYPYLGIGQTNPMGFQAYMHVAQEHATKALDAVKTRAADGGLPVPLDTLLVEDVTAHKGILQAAEDNKVDLIVVGSHGRNGIERLLLGSIAAKVASHSTRPVLIVR